MKNALSPFRLLLCCAFCSMTSAALAFSLPELEQLLQANSSRRIAYEEVRESPWLQAPVHSQGFMDSTPPLLEKKSHSPRQETWQIHPDHLIWRDHQSTDDRKIYFSQSPQIAILANAIRSLVIGDLQPLAQDFKIALSGNATSWQARLEPKTDDARRYLNLIEFSGSGSQIQTIIVFEPLGEKTTTTLFHTH